jgi:hypothetical protein
MPDLSPAAQSVKDAVLATYADNVPKDDSLWALERPSTVAALRAAADQVVPQPPKNWDLISPVAARECEIRKNLLAIATELDNANHTRGLLDD